MNVARFEGKTVIVTGAGSGIGKATAVRVANEGGKVVAADVVADRLDELKAENPSADIVTVVGDIRSDDDIAAILAAAGGPVQGLANVAGVMDSFQPAHEIDWAQWDFVLAVNLTATAKLMAAVLPGMLDADAGSIVNVSSEAGLRGSAAGAAYTASKHAVIGLSKNSAVMYGKKGIRVNVVAPGAVQTNIQASFASALAGEVLGPLMQVVIPGVAQPEELAASIAWLLSDDSSNVNGAVLANDGGWSAV
ncbi:MAG: SDR family oxidoreductase [Micrococcales bacterium]|nr:SDR family oxidoreductase [Micrococcales bacterium]